MKQAVRIQGADEIGLFRREYSDTMSIESLNLERIGKRHSIFNTPYGDGLYMKRGGMEWFCAYKSLDQMREWILEGELKELIEGGYRILLLELDYHQEGEHQIIFTKEGIVSSKDITDIFL